MTAQTETKTAPAGSATSSELDYVPLSDRPYGVHDRLLAQVGERERVLDVGCSTGYLARLFAERGSTVVGIESDPEAAAVGESACERVFVGDIESMELPLEPGSFDTVVCGDVIEHLRDPGAALARLRPLVRPDGKLVISTPNIANWAMRLSLLVGRFRYTERGILDRTHTHLFTRRTLLECVMDAGYEIRNVDFTVPVPGTRSRLLHRIAHAVGRLRPQLFAYQFVVVASPAPAGR